MEKEAGEFSHIQTLAQSINDLLFFPSPQENVQKRQNQPDSRALAGFWSMNFIDEKNRLGWVNIDNPQIFLLKNERTGRKAYSNQFWISCKSRTKYKITFHKVFLAETLEKNISKPLRLEAKKNT